MNCGQNDEQQLSSYQREVDPAGSAPHGAAGVVLAFETAFENDERISRSATRCIGGTKGRILQRSRQRASIDFFGKGAQERWRRRCAPRAHLGAACQEQFKPEAGAHVINQPQGDLMHDKGVSYGYGFIADEHVRRDQREPAKDTNAKGERKRPELKRSLRKQGQAINKGDCAQQHDHDACNSCCSGSNGNTRIHTAMVAHTEAVTDCLLEETR